MLAVSINSVETNNAYAKKLGVTFPLLCDTKRQVSKLYGVLSIFRVAKRATFVLDKQGIIRHIDRGGDAADPGFALKAVNILQ